VHYLATGASTGGQFGIYRWDMAATPSGSEPHFHRTNAESCYVLSGTVRLHYRNRRITGTPGHFLFVPEGGIHAFRHNSGQPANRPTSMLLLGRPRLTSDD